MPKKNIKKIKRADEVKQITVHSRAYGIHTRAARGSIKPVTLNDAVAAKAKEVIVINALASVVHTVLKTIAHGFKENMFWQKMLSNMHAAKHITTIALLNSLKGLELNSRYPLQRFGQPPQIIITLEKKNMTAALRSYSPLQLKDKIKQYRYDLIILFINLKNKVCGFVVLNSEWFDAGKVAKPVSFTTTIPAGSKVYVLCLRLHGGRNDEPLNELASQGMAVMQTGNC